MHAPTIRSKDIRVVAEKTTFAPNVNITCKITLHFPKRFYKYIEDPTALYYFYAKEADLKEQQRYIKLVQTELKHFDKQSGTIYTNLRFQRNRFKMSIHLLAIYGDDFLSSVNIDLISLQQIFKSFKQHLRQKRNARLKTIQE